MKKLFFAGIVMLATITSCQNSEGQINSEEQQHQTFVGKTAARGEENTDEREAMAEAIEIIKKDVELKGESNDSRILCHTSYFQPKGHACVSLGGYLFNVSWSSTSTDVNINGTIYTSVSPTEWTSTLSPRCNC